MACMGRTSVRAWQLSQISRPRLTFREQLVGGFVQMPLGALSICQVSNQLCGKLVNVHASEVIDLLSLEIENGRPKDDRYVDATAVEYFSVHDLPPIEGAPRQRLRLLGSDSETNRTWAISPSLLSSMEYFPSGPRGGALFRSVSGV